MSSFAYVPFIRETQKRCGLSLSDVMLSFTAQGRFDHRFSLDMEDHSGALATVTLRWTMCHRSQKPHNWSMSLLLHDIRIDGVDHEWMVKDHRGHKCSGWHRHIWSPGEESCEKSKECLDNFGRFAAFPEFMRDGCALLRIVLEEGGESYAKSGLLFA